MQWEYMVLKVGTSSFLGLQTGKLDGEKLSETLNELGLEGWEVATSVAPNSSNGSNYEIDIILKRPKQ